MRQEASSLAAARACACWAVIGGAASWPAVTSRRRRAQAVSVAGVVAGCWAAGGTDGCWALAATRIPVGTATTRADAAKMVERKDINPPSGRETPGIIDEWEPSLPEHPARCPRPIDFDLLSAGDHYRLAPARTASTCGPRGRFRAEPV